MIAEQAHFSELAQRKISFGYLDSGSAKGLVEEVQETDHIPAELWGIALASDVDSMHVVETQTETEDNNGSQSFFPQMRSLPFCYNRRIIT